MLMTLRRLLRRPGYFLTVVLVMGAGLGGALSLYGISDAVLFRPFDVDNAATLVRVFRSDDTLTKRDNWSRPVTRDYLDGSEAFTAVAHYADWPTLSHSVPGQAAVALKGALVSGNFFDVLGARPAVGRLLQVADDVEGAGIVGVLSYETWHSRFNARTGVVGESITLNDQPVTIVGVASPGFSGVSLVSSPEVWLPVASATHMALPGMPTQQFLHGPNMSWLSAVARLAPGVSLEQARASLESARLARDDADSAWPPAKLFLAREVATDPYGNRNIETIAWILFGLVAVLLVIVCADAAGLMLIRAEAARAETGVRLSLGATRGRIAGDVFREAGIVMACAGVLAVLMALLISGWLQRSVGADLALPDDPGALVFNGRVFAAFGGMLLLAIGLTAIAPVHRLGETRLVDVLRGARHGEARRAIDLRDGLVVLQVGISVLLLSVSLMFIGALRETLAVDPGIDVENRAAGFVSLPASDTGGADSFLPLLRSLRNDPRVASAAVALNVPVTDSGMRNDVIPQDYTPAPDEDMHLDINPVSDGYFEVLGIRLLRGRDFAPRGATGEGPSQALVNQAFVERFWPGRNAIGMHIEFGGRTAEVIGVVADNKQRDLRESPRPIVYTTFERTWVSAVGVVARANTSAIAMNAIRDAVQATGAPAVHRLESLQGRIDHLTRRDRAVTWLAAGAAVFATLLAVVGMYGIAAYAARQRQHEIGIRYALGATRPQVTRLFLRRGVIVASCGIACGAVATLLVGRHLAGAVAGMEPNNPLPLLVAAILFGLVALGANLLPVWRAANVAPMQVLRDE